MEIKEGSQIVVARCRPNLDGFLFGLPNTPASVFLQAFEEHILVWLKIQFKSRKDGLDVGSSMESRTSQRLLSDLRFDFRIDLDEDDLPLVGELPYLLECSGKL